MAQIQWEDLNKELEHTFLFNSRLGDEGSATMTHFPDSLMLCAASKDTKFV